ncbi:MAG: twin-arginine translocase subunit TatC [Ignavibacteria bacterium]|nr:twin-arginine translocase subunit TatC [Ignavibacteria bacterium]
MEEENNSKTEQNEVEMSFWEHLGELRSRIIKALAGVAIGTTACLVLVDKIVENILLWPAKHYHMELQNLKPFGQVMMYFEVAMICGVIVSIPNIFYQFWRFIAPALRKNERGYIKTIVAYSSLSFIIGLLFAFYVMLPMTLNFAVQFGTSYIKNQFSIEEYMDIILSVMLACGVVFELPLLSYFLSKIGILKPSFMRKYRRHAAIVLAFAAAILSPGTDPVSMIALAIPLLLLYEVSIIVSMIAVKKPRE